MSYIICQILIVTILFFPCFFSTSKVWNIFFISTKPLWNFNVLDTHSKRLFSLIIVVNFPYNFCIFKCSSFSLVDKSFFLIIFGFLQSFEELINWLTIAILIFSNKPDANGYLLFAIKEAPVDHDTQTGDLSPTLIWIWHFLGVV